MIDRETAIQILVSMGAVGVFVVVAAVVSGAYGTDNHLTETGGLALVGGIAVFVLVITVAGLWLAHQEFEDLGEDLGEDSDGDTPNGA